MKLSARRSCAVALAAGMSGCERMVMNWSMMSEASSADTQLWPFLCLADFAPGAATTAEASANEAKSVANFMLFFWK